MSLPPIKGFLETSFIDWPGSVAAVLFLPGCNFNCPYCHNQKLARQPHLLRSLEWQDIVQRLGHFKNWLDGVVISGGEPTLQAGLPDLLQAIKQLGFKTKLDTNGSQPAVLADLIRRGLLDMVAMDWKAPLTELDYRRASGVTVDLDALEETRRLIIDSALPHQFRSTVWPAWHGPREIRQMELEVGSVHYVLQPMQSWHLSDEAQNALGNGAPYSWEELRQLQMRLTA